LVVVTDTIPQFVTFVNSTPGYDSVSGRTYTWNIGNVSAYSNGTITITVTVNVSTDDGTVLNNTATMDYADANGNYYDQLSDDANVTVTAPVMSFTKSADVTHADPGDMIIYTLYYENSGSGNATLVVVTDTIPQLVTFVNSTPGYDSVSGRTYTWNIGDVPAYSNGTIIVRVTVNVSVDDGTVLQNNATMDYADANGNYYDQLSDDANVTVTAPVMSFSKTADVTEADPGDTIIYTLYYENSGSGNATLVVLEDTIPEYVTYDDSNPAYDSVSGRTYTWNIGNVSAYSNGTITLTVIVNISAEDGTVLNNTAILEYADANGNYYDPLEDYANVTVTAPILNITKTANVTVADPEDKITYTIKFENTGSGNATEVWINDTIPSYTTFISSTPGYNSSSGDTYTWYFALIESGENVTITIIVEVDVPTPDKEVLHNYVSLEYSDDNGNPQDPESAWADVNVTAPVLHIIKTVDESKADPGDTLVYKIEYWNSGTGWATLVEIVDTIPGATTHVDSSPDHNSSSGDEYTWTIGSVAPGANGTIWITVTVDVATPDKTPLHNVATLDYADANGNYYPQLDDYADTDVTAPVLHIIKTVDESKADPGDTLVYKIEYWNSGTGWATLVEIVDTIPGATTHVDSN